MEGDEGNTKGNELRGVIVRGTERIATRDALRALGLSEREYKHCKDRMRSLGWRGPKSLTFMGANGNYVAMQGYFRVPDVDTEGNDDNGMLSDDLPEELERVTRRGLKELSRVLRADFDVNNGNLIRSKVTAAGIAINAQLRADEHQLRRKTQGDSLARLLKLIEKDLPAISRAYKAIAPSHEAASLEAPPSEDE